jgi:hypothetical protein
MRSNWDTFQDARQQVLTDLQRVSRRANGIAPVVDPEDIGIIRNVIRPALDMGKFSEAGMRFIQASPYVNSMELYKYAGFWGDWGDSIWSGIKDVGSGLKDFGVGLGKTVAAPYYAIKGGLEGGWGGALHGLLSGPEQVAEGIGRVGGGVASAIPYARNYGVDLSSLGLGVVSPVDVAREVTPFLIPGGGALGLAGKAGKAAKILTGIPKIVGTAGAVAGPAEHWINRAGAAPAVAEATPGGDLSKRTADIYNEVMKQYQAGQGREVPPPIGHLSAGWMDAGRQA